MMVSRRRVLIVIVGVAIGSMVVGFVAARRVISPAESAARATPPEAGPITAPVERRHLESELVMRGDVQFAGAVEVHIAAAGWEGPTVVTGQVPKVGDEITEGDSVLELTGRPVLALGGQIPMYRSLRYGMRGPDVRQLQQALDRLGLDVGDIDGHYGGQTAEAVAELYRRADYEPPPVPGDAAAARDAAAREVEAATDALDIAEQALADAQEPSSELDRLNAEADVVAAQQHLDEVRQSTPEEPADPLEVAIAGAELDDAIQRRDELVSPDVTEQQDAVNDAHERLDDAEAALWNAASKAVTPLPETEVVFISRLPRRVDRVQVSRGETVESGAAVMTVSGATMVVRAEVSTDDAKLLATDMAVEIDAGGAPIPATIAALGRPANQDDADDNGDTDGGGDDGGGDDGGGDDGGSGERGNGDGDGGSNVTVTIIPDELGPRQRARLRDANVKVTVPIASTEGEVLAVPVAALSAGPDGGSRVELQLDDGTTELVGVEVGLTAEGYAEITADGEIEAGDQVVVGR